VGEFSVPAIATVADEENLTDVVWANAERFAGSISFRRRIDGSWVDITARDFATQVSAVAKGLISAGVQRGDRVAVLSRTRYEWTLVDYAIWAAGGSTVPIYETSSAEQVEWILADSGAKAVVVETAAHRETVHGLTDRLPELACVWQIEAPDGSGGAAAIDELIALGAGISDDAVRERARSVPADDLATLIYTSGTTGRPKGCELTHRNLLADIRAAVAARASSRRPIATSRSANAHCSCAETVTLSSMIFMANGTTSEFSCPNSASSSRSSRITTVPCRSPSSLRVLDDHAPAPRTRPPTVAG